MAVTRGGPARFGDLTGFPKTGVEMSWVVRNGRTIQLGDYHGPVAGRQGIGGAKNVNDWWNSPGWFQVPYPV